MFECHVTIEFISPTDKRYDSLCMVCESYGFRVARLYKWNKVTSDLDTFMTGHNSDFATLKSHMAGLIECLHRLRFKVTRYKIEQILLDSKNGDSI